MDLTLYGVNLWVALLLFARVGAMAILLPGLGETPVPARARLVLALFITFLMAPRFVGHVPDLPDSIWAMTGLIGVEIMIGIMFGAAARLLVSSLSTAGQIMGLETALSFAQMNDPTQEGAGGQIFGVFLGLLGVALIFATGLHHMFIAGIAGTYDVLAPGAAFPIEDGLQLAVDTVSASFRVGFQISMPLIAAGLIFRVGLGVLARLIPQIQVFFVILPLQLMGGFFVIMLGLSAGMLLWLDSLDRYAHWLR